MGSGTTMIGRAMWWWDLPAPEEFGKGDFSFIERSTQGWKEPGVGKWNERVARNAVLWVQPILRRGCVLTQGWGRARVQGPRERREAWPKWGYKQFIMIDQWDQAIQLIIWVKEWGFSGSMSGLVIGKWGGLFKGFYQRPDKWILSESDGEGWFFTVSQYNQTQKGEGIS